MKIRNATLKDWKQIEEITKEEEKEGLPTFSELYFAKQAKKQTIFMDKSFITDKDCLFLVACEGNKITGYIFCENRKGGFWADEMIVRKRYRGKGIGTKLMQTACKGKRKIHILVNKKNKKAIKLYNRLGFKKIIEELVMIKN